MDKKIPIAGVWKGELTYGEEYGPELQNKKLKFRLILEENNGDITGECTDIEGTGVVPVPASINGFIEEDMISFVKQYPECYIIDKNGKVGTIPDKEPPEINYSGYYNEDDNSFEGDWHMIVEVKQYTFGFAESGVSGEWKIIKED